MSCRAAVFPCLSPSPRTNSSRIWGPWGYLVSWSFSCCLDFEHLYCCSGAPISVHFLQFSILHILLFLLSFTPYYLLFLLRSVYIFVNNKLLTIAFLCVSNFHYFFFVLNSFEWILYIIFLVQECYVHVFLSFSCLHYHFPRPFTCPETLRIFISGHLHADESAVCPGRANVVLVLFGDGRSQGNRDGWLIDLVTDWATA